MLRGGRTVLRVLAVWLLTAGALVLLDRLLTGFAMDDWWQPTVLALALGVLSAVVWPLILRVALPVALYTLGIASYLVLGGALLLVSFAIPGVTIVNLSTAVGVAVVMSLVGALVSGLLAIDQDEWFYRRTARRPGATEDTDDRPPGVVFLQVDGLGHDTLRRALRSGEMPVFSRWLAEGSHALTHWNTDWSSQTGAGVCGILHGDSSDILGFRWYEKDTDHVMACSSPEDAAEIERRHSNGRGLLAVDGAGRGNLFTGDAPHVSLTMSAVPLLAGLGRRGGSEYTGYFAYFASPANTLRTLGSALAEIVRELSASIHQRRRRVHPRVNRGLWFPFVRAGTNVIARDVVVSAVIEDMLDGRAAVYADFLGYDEVAHYSGVERWDALAVLRDIDVHIGRIHRATQLAPRRYLVVALSDHGQTQGWAFADRFGESVEQLVGRLCGDPSPSPAARGRSEKGWQAGAVLAEASAGGGFVARRLRDRVERARAVEDRDVAQPGLRDRVRRTVGAVVGRDAPDPAGDAVSTDDPARDAVLPARDGDRGAAVARAAAGPGVLVGEAHGGDGPAEASGVARVAPGVAAVASGHMAMVSFPDRPGRVVMETIEREYPELLPGLVDHPGIGFVLVRSAELGPVVLGRDGLHRLETGIVVGVDPLAAYGPHAPGLVRRVDGFANCCDIMINSAFDPATEEASPFEPHVGSHGGLGGPQSRGFLLHPVELPAPEAVLSGEIVGSEALHRVLRAWLTHLGHPEPTG
ncbi:MAG: phage holin family protein [Pseudonocardiales bacterium]|nr:phage holin family protein [Pseudonocardiales bacterium]